MVDAATFSVSVKAGEQFDFFFFLITCFNFGTILIAQFNVKKSDENKK